MDREGGLSDNHLVETGALSYLNEQAKYVKRIHVVNGAKGGSITSALKGEEVGSYIVKD